MHTVGFTYHGPTEEGRGGEETRKRKGRGKGRPVEPGAGGGKGKGKGKEQDPLNGLAVRGQSVISAEGKRRQKLSTKARDATEATEKGGMHANDGAFEMTDEDADGSTVAEDDKEGEEDGIKISVKTGPARKRQDKSNPRLVKALQSNKPLTNGILKQLAEEPTTCHHCRRKTHVEKMRCTVFKAFGPCGKRYCVSCVLKR